MITHKLTHNQWKYVATEGKVYVRENVVSITRTKDFVKEKFKGSFNIDIGFGHITFESEKDLTWFLLKT